MNLRSIKTSVTLCILILLINGCGDLQNEIPVNKPSVSAGISQINVNGKILIPIETFDDQALNFGKKLTTIYEYNSSDNNFKKTLTTIPNSFIGYALIDDMVYIATAQAIATYKLIDSKLEHQNYLPTPKGDFIVACFAKNNELFTISSTTESLIYWKLENKEWKQVKIAPCEKTKSPNSALTTILSTNFNYSFWEKNKNVYFINLEEEPLKVKETSIKDLKNICVWIEKEELLISGFNEKFELTHYQIKNLDTPNITTIKADVGNYPPITFAPSKISLLPIQINQQLKGFVYGTINNAPIWITEENKVLPSSLITQADEKRKNSFYSILGTILGTIFLISFLSWLASNEWEKRLIKLNIPRNTIFFGPTIHRGMAYIIDVLTITFITCIAIYIYNKNFDIMATIMQLNQIENETLLWKKIPLFFIVGYITNLVYGTLTEYFLGNTLGKYSLGLKVYSAKDLSKLHILQAIGRNLVPKFPMPWRIPFVLFSNFSIALTVKKKSLSDYVGNSVVIYERLHKKLNIDLPTIKNDK